MTPRGEQHPDPRIESDLLGETIKHTEAIGDAQAIIEAARAGDEPRALNPDTPQVLTVPAGASAFLPDLSAWRAAPSRRTGCYRPATVEAFQAVTSLYSDEATTLWVHPTSGKVVAVFDDNCDDGPGWREHRAELQLQHTHEWLHWASLDRKMVDQETFAEHIEAGLEEIAVPDAADVLEIAQTFHASHEATFRSQKRLASGQVQFMYDEQIKASAGQAGELTVPTTIMLALAPFLAEERVKITARLRFRLQSGKLTLGYFLDRPEQVLQAALEGVAERLAAQFARVFVGEPE